MRPHWGAVIDSLESDVGMRGGVTRTKDLGDTVKTVGNPDLFRLVCKVAGANFVKSTKAMAVPGGCLVQVSTRETRENGAVAVAEAISFIPGVRLVDNADGTVLIVEQASGE